MCKSYIPHTIPAAKLLLDLRECSQLLWDLVRTAVLDESAELRENWVLFSDFSQLLQLDLDLEESDEGGPEISQATRGIQVVGANGQNQEIPMDYEEEGQAHAVAANGQNHEVAMDYEDEGQAHAVGANGQNHEIAMDYEDEGQVEVIGINEQAEQELAHPSEKLESLGSTY
ncbi:hypothetical protein MHYP_G00232780 [Metynnis hypsauchen]